MSNADTGFRTYNSMTTKNWVADTTSLANGSLRLADKYFPHVFNIPLPKNEGIGTQLPIPTASIFQKETFNYRAKRP